MQTDRRPSQSKLVGLEFNFNPDEGFVPLLKVGFEKMGFERNPFTSKFVLSARYISLTQAVDFTPEAHFANIFARWNLKMNGRLTSNNYTENFFGFGNDSPNEFGDFDANRIFMQRLNLGVSTYREGAYGSTFEFGAHYDIVSTEESGFIDIGNASGERTYLSLAGHFNFKSVDDDHFPTRGLLTSIHAKVSDNLQNTTTVLSLDSKMAI